MDDQKVPRPASDAQEKGLGGTLEHVDGSKDNGTMSNGNELFDKTHQTNWAVPLQQITAKALDFLSHASNETLGACLVGLGATTYFILGRVGLVVIGIAGGVVLHATWESNQARGGNGAIETVEQQRRREAGIEVVRRVLDLRNSRDELVEQDKEDSRVYANQQLDFSRFEPETAKALDTFANGVIKDYVHYWYDPTLPGEASFPASCKRTFVAFMLSLSGHLERKRPADAFLDFVTNASSIIIVFLNELSAALNASPNVPAEDAVAKYLELKPDSNLTHILDTKYQDSKLKAVAEDTLQAYLDPKAYNCPPVHSFLREVMAQLVLSATVTLCSRPEWINEWIVYGLEESETTKEVMDLVDAGVEGRQVSGVASRNDQTAVSSKKEKASEDHQQSIEHKRHVSRAEEAMDEAMKEAQRLTQLMIEEDERNNQDGHGGLGTARSSGEDVSDASATHGAPTPTSSQSDRDRQEQQVYSGDESSVADSPKEASDARSSTPVSKQPFTTFDQLLPPAQPTALSDLPVSARKEQAQFTLHNAIISIFDDSMPGERSSIKSKPVVDYMIQIEPASSAFPGWMIARKYADFEVLHEVLRRISVITGAKFTESHGELPKWKGNTKAALRNDLEKYLTAAVRFPTLAESEGMKRFLEKEQGNSRSPSDRGKQFGWPTPETFGKFGGNMIDVLAKAPKEVAGGVTGGGKAFFGNVAGLVGGKRPQSGANQLSAVPAARPEHRTNPSMGQAFMTDTYLGSMSLPKQSQESVRSMSTTSLERTGSTATASSARSGGKGKVMSQRASNDSPRPASFVAPPVLQSSFEPAATIEETFNLPPPPSDITDDYGSPARSNRASVDTFRSSNLERSIAASVDLERPLPAAPAAEPAAPSKTKQKAPITEQETAVAIELMFAVITELYTLSSAWQIRRTLLAAAKTFLLRPGNPQLTSIRDLLQASLLDSNLSDAGMAAHLQKLRENALPTAEELEIWARDYPPKSDEEKEQLRIKARKLLVQKGMPQALTSVMGAAASGEALGKVFDCLQIPAVSRGLIFGLLLQALKVVTH